MWRVSANKTGINRSPENQINDTQVHLELSDNNTPGGLDVDSNADVGFKSLTKSLLISVKSNFPDLIWPTWTFPASVLQRPKMSLLSFQTPFQGYKMDQKPVTVAVSALERGFM